MGIFFFDCITNSSQARVCVCTCSLKSRALSLVNNEKGLDKENVSKADEELH